MSTQARLLGALAARLGLTAAAIHERLGPPDSRLQPAEQDALWAFRARGTEPLEIFVRLYLLGLPVPAAQARALWAADHARAVKAGLVRSGRGGVRAGLALAAPEGTLVYADPHADRARPEYVPGPTRSTLVLERALPRAAVGRALELGTGAGYLALRLAALAREVTATDVSRRALALAGLNLALHDARNVTLVRADRFAGIDGTYDLVIGNLPFVVAPRREYRYRDSGLPEDELVASVIAGAGPRLAEGGFAIFLAQWVHREGEPEDERLAPWFAAAGCDALALRLEAETADTYAARWSAGPAPISAEERLTRLERWALHLRRARIHGVSTGLIVLRRRAADRHLMSIDEVDPGAATPAWAEIAARFAVLTPA